MKAYRGDHRDDRFMSPVPATQGARPSLVVMAMLLMVLAGVYCALLTGAVSAGSPDTDQDWGLVGP